MTAPELERQERLQVTASDGTTHRFYTHDELQAAIEVKNAQIIDLIEALRKRSNGELCGCGVDNPTDVCLSHYDVIEAVVRNRVQAAIARAEQAETQVVELETRVVELEGTLHRISLGSQNSMTSKEGLGKEARAAFARAEKAEADRDEWRKTAITKIEMADSTALRDKDATIATLQARVRELESAFSHLYGQAVWLRGDQAYRDFARAFIKRMSALRIKCVSRQELAKIEGKTE